MCIWSFGVLGASDLIPIMRNFNMVLVISAAPILSMQTRVWEHSLRFHIRLVYAYGMYLSESSSV